VSGPSKQRLDKELLRRGLVTSRSQAEDIIQRGFVTINHENVTKPGFLVDESSPIKIKYHASFVSRAGEKLYSVIEALNLNFNDKIVLDVGSSTGGFTDLALQKGAKKVIAVDVGTNQMHDSLRQNPRVALHEKTDIRDFQTAEHIDVVVIDVSFISLREILPTVRGMSDEKTIVIAMVKPQFEAGQSKLKHKGVIKNDQMRRTILKEFEAWVQKIFIIVDKADSKIAGSKGNVERFYKLRLPKTS
jgi:23S rRNA (cytidine1920-2'-O)/16S rRNA (cytidine1409-2'-O)-methyltransferase